MPWKCCVFACKTNYKSQQDKTMRSKLTVQAITSVPANVKAINM